MLSAAQALVESLSIIRDIDDRGAERLGYARSTLAGQSSETLAQILAADSRAMRLLENNTVARERAMWVAIESLLVLSSDPQFRNDAQEIFGLLRQMRLIELGEPQTPPPIKAAGLTASEVCRQVDQATGRELADLSNRIEHARSFLLSALGRSQALLSRMSV